MAAPATLVASSSDRTTLETPQSVTEHVLEVGIDKLALSVPIQEIVQNRDVWTYVSPGFAVTQEYMGAETSSLHIKARRVGHGLRCTVEFNPSRIVDPYGWSLCRLSEVPETIKRVLYQLDGRVEVPDVGLEEMLVTRIDLARDFRVRDPQFYLTALQPLARPMVSSSSLNFNPKTGGASSLVLRTSRSANPRRPNRVTLYDKGHESKSAEAQGILRWEVEARTWAETYGDIKTLADLTPEHVRTLALDRWAWSRVGEVVVSENEVMDRAFAAEWLPPLKRDRFLVQYFALLRAKDVFESEYARTEFHKTQRKLGVAASTRRGLARRLDFYSGTEISEVPDLS